MRGPPLTSGPMTTSGTPSPLRSPAATTTPPLKSQKGDVSKISARVCPSQIRTRLWMPAPLPTMMSPTPSPVTSARTTRAPPVKSDPNGVIVKSGLPSELYTPTVVETPASVPTAIAAGAGGEYGMFGLAAGPGEYWTGTGTTGTGGATVGAGPG